MRWEEDLIWPKTHKQNKDRQERERVRKVVSEANRSILLIVWWVFAGLDNPPVVAALWRERKKEWKEKDFREWEREGHRNRKREILERVRWWLIWRWDLKPTSKITTSTTTTNFNHFPVHFFFFRYTHLFSFFISPFLDWILSKPHLNFSAYLYRSSTFPSFLVKMVIWVCLVSLIWAVKIYSFLNYNVDYVHGFFFLSLFVLCFGYVLVFGQCSILIVSLSQIQNKL